MAFEPLLKFQSKYHQFKTQVKKLYFFVTCISPIQLYGVKWKSNMPRFAADLSSNPLQPIKSTTPANHPPTVAVMKPHVQSSNSKLATDFKSTTTSAATSHSNVNYLGAEVPAVHFDWNSAGLVNPLDGEKKLLKLL
jgi:hypothetical protein